MKIRDEDDQQETNNYGDSDFLADNDLAIKKFRASEKDTKRKIIDKMLTLRHNMKYNKHLLSVYMKAKALFDEMVEEHRLQIDSLDEIYRHLNQMIRENLSKQRIQKKKDGVSSEMLKEMTKDKNRIGALLKKMRISYQKLMNIDTILGVTVDKINEITFIEDVDGKTSDNKYKEDDDANEEEMDDEEDDDEYNDDEDEEYVHDEEDEEEGDDEDEEEEDDEDEEEDEEEDDKNEEDDEHDEEEDDKNQEDNEHDEEEDDEDDEDEDEDNDKRAILVF
jgi:cobalamin biosynthesis protein CobT